MIEFEHQLPSMWVNEPMNGLYNNPELNLPGILTTKDSRLGSFMMCLRNTVANERRLIFIDNQVIICNHNWVRDHVHKMKAFKHWEYALKSFLDFMIANQTKTGFFYELIKQIDDGHHTYVDESCRKIYEDDCVAMTRLELEADVEYLMVEGVWQYYRATGDIEWVKKVLPQLEKSIDYMTSDNKRWNKELGLVIRPFTIDTWDFTNNEKFGTDRRIHDDEKMCAMHGDNSGVFEAMQILAFFNTKFGNIYKAQEWKKRAEKLKENMFKYLWNGKFFIHQLYINHSGLDDKENIRLSLSNGYDMNRGVTTIEQSRSIIEEYMQRRKTTDAFAEWFSIDPPYEQFLKYKPGEYVNGSISPFTAGELALASFNNGYEEYGYDIISRLMKLFERDGMIYFVYDRTSNNHETASGPSGWGSAAILNAIDEGLAGIVDKDCLYKEIDFSPRFVVTEYKELRYFTGYEISKKFIDLRYILKDNGLRYDLHSDCEKINAHIMLPNGKNCTKLLVNDNEVPFTINKVYNSTYVDCSVKGKKVTKFEILF